MDEQYELPPGAVTIAPGVLTTIVRMTTLAHPGVLRLAPRMPPSLPRLRGKGAQAEGLRIELSDDNAVTVDVHVIADPSASLTDLGKVLQTQIARALEDMAGMEVRSVNVFIDEIVFDAGGKGAL
ncbi:MAG: Asp23/Gls24 family envelope stress response protein [Anaerolineae bacterium]